VGPSARDNTGDSYVAHTLSAKKRIRQNAKRRARNRWRKDQIRHAVKAFDEAVRAGDRTKAADQLNVCFKKLDQVAAKNTIHKNAAARKKAHLSKRLDAMGA
jgi:small subunit ribosomal protein S20